MSQFNERALVFNCEGEALTAILHEPDQPANRGMLLIVGGPQYRVGSHRQFVEFARAMADSGVAVMRFDYRGMGDTSGPYLDFEQVQLDVTAALDELVAQCSGLKTVSVFGLCDAASTALMFLTDDARVNELVLLNPWVRSEASEAKAVVKHYYAQRLLSTAFWKKLFSGEVKVVDSLRDALAKLRLSRTTKDHSDKAAIARDFRDLMLQGAQRFSGRVLLVLSGNDFTANEFEDTVNESPQWRQCVDQWTLVRVPEANHTFARSDWKQQVVASVREWMNA